MYIYISIRMYHHVHFTWSQQSTMFLHEHNELFFAFFLLKLKRLISSNVRNLFFASMHNNECGSSTFQWSRMIKVCQKTLYKDTTSTHFSFIIFTFSCENCIEISVMRARVGDIVLHSQKKISHCRTIYEAGTTHYNSTSSIYCIIMIILCKQKESESEREQVED